MSLCRILSVKSEFLRWVHIEGEGELDSLLMGGVVLEELVGPYELLWRLLENAVCRIRQGGLGWGCTGDAGEIIGVLHGEQGRMAGRSAEHALRFPGGGVPGTGNSKGKALGKTEPFPLNELGNH